MRSVVQRVISATVRVSGEVVASLGAGGDSVPGPGLLALVGVGRGDGPHQARALAEKLAHVRLLADASGRMSLSALETGGGVLVVSQFTLYGDLRRGRRPSFGAAASAEAAAPLVEEVVSRLGELGVRVASGRFGAHMALVLHNDGPVTMLLEA